MIINIMTWVNSKKNKKIQICSFPLLRVKKQFKDSFSEIVKECSLEGELSNHIIKQSLKSISEYIYGILVDKENQHEKQEQSQIKQLKEKLQILFQQRGYYNFSKGYCNKQSLNQKNLQKSIELKIKNFEDRMKALQLKSEQQYSKIGQQVSELGDKISEQLNEKLQELSKLFTHSQETQTIIKKLKILGENVDNLHDKFQIEKKNIDKNYELMINYIKQKMQHSKFKVTGNLIECIGEVDNWEQYIFNKHILHDQIYTFGIRIVKNEKNVCNSFMIGVIDLKKRKDQIGYTNSVVYFGNAPSLKGYKYPGNIQEGDGFGQGDIIKVVVNLINKTIIWYVNNKKQAQYALAENTLYAPVVFFRYKNSKVQWIQA